MPVYLHIKALTPLYYRKGNGSFAEFKGYYGAIWMASHHKNEELDNKSMFKQMPEDFIV